MKSIFISSTFKDMQVERDLLHERIFPRLRRVIAEYGEDVQELDLRWGVDTANMTEEESGRLVLKVCIDAIDRCLPFIIVLLGERYGWIPREDIIASANDTRVNEQYQPGMSITNLEIQYGALKEEEVLERCVFCMRNPEVMDEIEPEYLGIYEGESAEHKKKLSDLKAKIREKKHAVILDYDAKWDADKHKISGLEAFGEELYRILENMIREEYKDHKKTDWREKILLETKRTKEQYLSSYVERPIEEASVCQSVMIAYSLYRMETGYHNLAAIKGVAGTGKSALMAACAGRLENIGYPVILYFSGNPGCQDPKVLKQIMIYELENIFKFEHEETEMTLDERLHLLDERARFKKVICMIDALDQLYEKEKEPELDFVRLCPNIIFVTSFLEDFKYTQPMGKKIVAGVVEVQELTKETRAQMIAYTAGKRGKKLDDVVTEDITEKSNSRNPLYLSNMLQRFFMMDGKEFEAAEKLGAGMDGIHRYMEQLLSEMPEKQEEMVLYLLKETMRHFDAEYLYEVMCLIALSKFGLKESELSGLLEIEGKKFAQIEFQQLVSYLYEAFVQKEDGKWTFKHRLFLEAMREHMSEKEKENCLRLLVQYAKKDETFLKQEGYYYVLEQKDLYGSEVLEHWSAYHPDHLGEWITELVEQDEAYEAYFLGLVELYATDQSAEFWKKKYEQYVHHRKGETFHIQVLQKLIENENVHPKIQCDCIDAVMQYCSRQKDYETIKAYIEKLEIRLSKMTGAEQEYQYALWYNWKASVAFFYEKDKLKSLEYDKKSVEHIERAEKLDPENEEILLQKIFGKDNLYWDYKEEKQELHPEFLESELEDLLKHSKELNHSKFTKERIVVLGNLAVCYSYKDSGHFNMELSKRYGAEALKLGREYVKRYPTMENMAVLVRVLDQMAYLAEYQYKYLFDKEAYWYCEKRYETCLTFETKEVLARTCMNLGGSAIYAWEEYQADKKYEIETKSWELEKEIIKYLEQAIGLYEELLEERQNHPDYIRFIQNCKLEKAQFELKKPKTVEERERIAEEIKPVAEELLKTGPDRYIYDAFEILADIAKGLNQFSKVREYAETMLSAASRLLQAKDTKFNRRRVFKSLIFQARARYMENEDVEELLKKDYHHYQEMDEKARAGQRVLVNMLYRMSIQTQIEKGRIDEAKRLRMEAEQLNLQMFFEYFDMIFSIEGKQFHSAFDFAKAIQDIKHLDVREKRYLGSCFTDILLCSDSTEKDFRWIDQEYWEYIIEFTKDVDEIPDSNLTQYLARYCFDSGEYENTLIYLGKMKEDTIPELLEERELLRVLCQALISGKEKDYDTVRFLMSSVKEMPYYQKLSWKKPGDLSPHEEVVLYEAYELLSYVEAGEEKSRIFEWMMRCMGALKNDSGKFKWNWKTKVMQQRLFGRSDIKEIFQNISMESLYQMRGIFDYILDFVSPEADKLKACLNIADRFEDGEEKRYRNLSWTYYQKAFREKWKKPFKMELDVLKFRIRAYEGILRTQDKYEIAEMLRYQLLLFEYYKRTKDKTAFEKLIRNNKKIEEIEAGSGKIIAEVIGEKYAIREAEENTLEIFKELTLMQGDCGVRDYVEHLENENYLNVISLAKLMEFKETVREHVSENEMESFNRMMERKGRNELTDLEKTLKLRLFVDE